MQDEYNKKALFPEQYKEQQAQYAREQIQILPYIQEVIKKRQATLTSGTMRVWSNFLTKYQEFEGKNRLTFGEMSREKVEDFITFIANYKSKKVDKLAANSQKSMIRCFQAVLNEAWKDEIITFNPNHAVEMPKGEQKQKEFLTLPELQALNNTECSNDTVKRISLFSALTGLRHSDCVGLRWENINGGDTPNIKLTQQKTKKPVFMPISAEALALCGERKAENDNVFNGVSNSQFCNTIISEWVKKAKIKKDITFHCFRHTFATLQLTQGTDIYTVSKMLGHSDVKTTQIYAQLVDEKKQAAANAIKLNINNNWQTIPKATHIFFGSHIPQFSSQKQHLGSYLDIERGFASYFCIVKFIKTIQNERNKHKKSTSTIEANDILEVLGQHNFSNQKQIDVLQIIDLALYKKQYPDNIRGIIKRKIQLLQHSEQETAPTDNNLHLSTKKGFKVNFIRVINCLCELSYFTDSKGNNITKKEVFKSIGNATNTDFSTYQNILSTTKAAAKSDMKSILLVFEQLHAKQLEINNK